MSKPSAVSKVVASLEAERAELLARAAVIEQVVSKLLVAAKPKLRMAKAKLKPVEGESA